MLAGADNRLVVPLSTAAGGAFLVLSDAACRALGEVPIGTVTATCGAPFFLWLLARKRMG
jgi:iron complex transport system permease protein